MGNCCTTLSPDELAAVEVCGGYSRVIYPGFTCLGLDLGGICINTRTLSTRVTPLSFQVDTKTKDDVTVRISVVIQREVLREKVFEALYSLDNPTQQIESYVMDVVRSEVPRQTLDEVFEEKERLAACVKDRLDRALGDFGQVIHSTLITDLSPDSSVQAAMNAIQTQSRLREAASRKAEAEKILKIKVAEAEAESKFLQGQGIAKQRGAIVEGLKATQPKGTKISPERISELLVITQYFDTMERIASGKAQTVFCPSEDTLRNAFAQGAQVSKK